jgi:DNA end-binding protein Ku
MPKAKSERKANATKKRTDAEPEAEPVSRAIWKGSITFGLVNIPVSLHSAETSQELSFKLLDRRNLSPVHYKRVNEQGKEVSWDDIVKGYEYEKGQFVVVTDEDFQRANVEATQAVEITDFVDAAEIQAIYYDKPYYLAPEKRSAKSYALLREVLRRSGKVGIAKIVLRSRQYIAAVYPLGAVLVVNLLRYAYEVRSPSSVNAPEEGLRANGLSEGELKMASRLVDAMVDEWRPEKYQDTYREDLLELIRNKVETGETEAIEPLPPAPRRTGKVVDIMELLKRSLEQAEKTEGRTRRRTEGRRKAG